jgi:Tat protein secretion system quality control protein TatD with DNase activity
MSRIRNFSDTHCHLFRTADAVLLRKRLPQLSGFTITDDYLRCQDADSADRLIHILKSLPGNELSGITADFRSLAQRTLASGVKTVMVPSVSGYEGYRNHLLGKILLENPADEKQETCPELVFGIGTHPMYADGFSLRALENEYAILKRALENEYSGKLSSKGVRIFVGEIGIDRRFKETVPIDVQVKAFREQLMFARDNGLPVSVHAVGGDNEILHELKRISGVRGILHAFTGGTSRAEQYMRHGLKLGIGPMLMAQYSEKLREAVLNAGMNRIVTETDFPYMYFNVRNSSSCRESIESSNTPTAEKIMASPDRLHILVTELAAIFDTAPETMSEVLLNNAENLFYPDKCCRQND